MIPLLLVGAGYLSGSIPFGLILTKVFAGKDVRAAGSGNIGATNVARVAGKKLGAVVLVLDAAKGALPVLAALLLFPEDFRLHVAVGFAAFLGHVFPVWLRFVGGKGVATAGGVLAVLLPQAALVGFVLWSAIVLIFRVSSIGSLVGGLAAIVVAFFLGKPIEYPALAVALLIGMIFTHRENIGRIIRHEEKKV